VEHQENQIPKLIMKVSNKKIGNNSLLSIKIAAISEPIPLYG